jgi:hypothetical protein
MKIKGKKLANDMSSIFKIDPSNISFGPRFENFHGFNQNILWSPPLRVCPVLALTKVGSAHLRVKIVNESELKIMKCNLISM